MAYRPSMTDAWVYMLRCADGSLYIGRGRWHFRPLLIDDVSSR